MSNTLYYGSPVNRSCQLNTGLVSWWMAVPWYSSGPRFIDLCGKNHGTLTNGPAWRGATERHGWYKSLYFDGTDDYVNCGAMTGTQPTTDITVAMWVAPATSNTKTAINKMVDAFSDGWACYVSTDAVLFYIDEPSSNVYQTGLGWTANKWHRLVITKAYTSLYSLVYVDGKPLTVTNNLPRSSMAVDSTGNLAIGARPSGDFSNFWNGRLDDVRILNRVWSAGEVSADYLDSCQGYPRTLNRLPRRLFSSISGVVFDAASNSGYQAAQSTYSWSHTCTGSDRLLTVDVSLLSVAGTSVSGITYNSVPMTLVGVKSTVSGAGRVESWRLIAPTTGSNTIAVTLSAVAASAGTAVSYTGVHQTSPTEGFASAQATNVGAADAEVSCVSVADNCRIHAACVSDDATITAEQTTRNNVTGELGSGANEDSGPITPAGSTTMSYTDVGALATWAIVAYAIRPVASVGLGGTLLPKIMQYGLYAGGVL